MRCVVVGAGVSGLMAARAIQSSGHDVIVLDKGRGPGGRLATRRVGRATFDHGAQFFTVRTEQFDRHVGAWVRAGVVREWCRGFGPIGDGFPRYVAERGMNALAKHLATGLDVRANQLVFAVRPGAGPTARRWSVGLDDGSAVHADALAVTCPLPQAFSILVATDVEIPSELRDTQYDRTICLMVVLDRPSAVPDPGGVQNPDHVFSFIGDNLAKGISAEPALTLHANPAWSEAHWERDRDDLRRDLLEHAAPWLGGATAVADSMKRWRFATPRAQWPAHCWFDPSASTPLVLAGDAFLGPRVEGAALSGLAAADYIVG
jgi:predicted NAD/FAD-dependent oxidoreductase